MNIKNCKKVLNHIKKHPETWDQGLYHCTTRCCFAGHAQIFSGNKFSNSHAVLIDAMCYLDITIEEANYLFSPKRTIEDFDNFLKKHEELKQS
jgi:hypothetical protein